MKRKLIVMVGLQGSGKSTIAKEIAKNNKHIWESTSGPNSNVGQDIVTEMDAPIISSDDIRKEQPDWDNDKVFNEVYDRINLYFQRGAKCVIMDSTAITIKSRKQIFEKVKFDCEKVAYIVNTPIEICRTRLLERNKKYEEYINSLQKAGQELKDNPYHLVPLNILDKYWKSFQLPLYGEGFSDIIIHNEADELVKYTFKDIQNEMDNFNQKSKWHSLSLGKHSAKVYNIIKDWYDKNKENPKAYNLVLGAYLHDVGKLWTQTFKEGFENANYYSHENVGAYWKLSEGLFTYEAVLYENYHMIPYILQKDKSINKWKKLLGEAYEYLLILHEADKTSH